MERKYERKLKMSKVVTIPVSGPIFASASGNGKGDDGFLSEYLTDGNNNTKGSASRRKMQDYEKINEEVSDDDMSDEDDMSCDEEEGDGKRPRLDDRPKTKDQIDRRRLVIFGYHSCCLKQT